MWNWCLRNNKVSAQEENEKDERKVEKMKTVSSGMKKVRFKIEDGGEGDSTSGAVRIRVVVTKEELKWMLRNNNGNDPQHTSLEQLLSDMMMRDKRVFEVEKIGGSINSWRPALESIPEDRSIR